MVCRKLSVFSGLSWNITLMKDFSLCLDSLLCCLEEVCSPLLSIPAAILNMNISDKMQDTLVTYHCLSTLQLRVYYASVSCRAQVTKWTENLRKKAGNQGHHLLPTGKGSTGLWWFTPAELTSLPHPTKRTVVSTAESLLLGSWLSYQHRGSQRVWKKHRGCELFNGVWCNSIMSYMTSLSP